MPAGHVDKTKPLRPLSDHAWHALSHTSREDVPRYYYNAGVWDRLFREELVEQAGNHGTMILYRITAAGRAKLETRNG